MEVKQVYEFVNTATSEVLGRENVLKEDLSNVVDVGTEIFNANAVDNYVRSLVNHIGRVIFVNRAYRGNVPSVLMDGWEFGSVLEKIAGKLPEATENESFELQDQTSYDPNVFYSPKVTAKFFNKKVTFEIPCSFAEKRAMESFSNAIQLNAFVSMLFNDVEKSMTVKIDSLIARTINNMIAETVHDDFGANSISGGSGVKAVNLLYLYNQSHAGATITAAKALETPEFIRFAAYTMNLYTKRLSRMSSLFNVGGEDRFTPEDMLHFVTLADFNAAADVYLQSNVYHDEFTRLPKSETVPYWQGSGTSYAFADISKVYVKSASGDDVTVTGVLGVMFDRDALGVSNLDRRVTTNYNPKGEFYTNWYKFDAGYFNDLNENCVVFFVA